MIQILVQLSDHDDGDENDDDDDDDDDCQMFLSSLAGKRLLQKRAIEVCTKTSIFSG